MDPQDQNQAGGAFTDTGARHDEPDARSTNLEDGTSFSIAVDAQASAFVDNRMRRSSVPFADKNGRVTLLATSILPDYRGQGLATELTRRVLDSIRAEGKSATVRCPVFRSFIERNPEYAAMVDIPGTGRDGRDDA
ncbi:hypothetical protein BJF82_14065 [Kytococcus sp. CUA-901]|nr:hypothetical protein BJF82_14065 [Kytococcus sp. CUA-901]